MPIDEPWHKTHMMPRDANERVGHIERARECGCRAIPAKLLATMRERGMA